MPSCAFIKCTNNSGTKNKVHGISFHTFPEDELLRNKWLLVVRQQRQEPDWSPTNHSRICSMHFKSKDMYTTNKGYRKLYKSAMPYFRTVMITAQNSLSKPASPNPLNSVNSSDFETSRKSFKRKLNIETMKKLKLMQDNKSLKKINKRLNHKCRNFIETIIQLKKKIIMLEEHCNSFQQEQFSEISIKVEVQDSVNDSAEKIE